MNQFEFLFQSTSWHHNYLNFFAQVELVNNSGVWIESSNLDHFKIVAGSDYKKMVRLLLKELVGLKKLANSCAHGNSTRGPINRKIFNSIEGMFCFEYKYLQCARIRQSIGNETSSREKDGLSQNRDSKDKASSEEDNSSEADTSNQLQNHPSKKCTFLKFSKQK